MTKLQLLLRNLRYFRGVNVAVILGMAVATAVLTGALMVGDSVRGSLADLAVRRLGPVDYALISTRFFDQSLADRIGNVTPGIIIRGGASNDSVNRDNPLRTADVQIGALGGDKNSPFASSGFPLPRGAVTINGELARDLAVSQDGVKLLLSVPTQGDTPRESALARRGVNDVLNELPVTVRQVATGENFASLFNPNATQRVPRNAWVNLTDLQEQIEQDGRVNVLLAHENNAGAKSQDNVKSLNDKLRQVVQLGDYGITRKSVGDGEVSYFARETYFFPPAVDAAKRAAGVEKTRLREVSVNLINTVTRAESHKAANIPGDCTPPNPFGIFPGGPSGGSIELPPASIHYAVAAGITSLDEGSLAENEIAINEWTAVQLVAQVGDQLKIDFYLRQPGGDLTDASKVLPASELTFTVKQILPMTGLGADPQLPPNYKGLTDAKSVADWDPPAGLNIDKKLVTKADEDYWHQYHAAPKLFFNFDTAHRLWGGVYGDVTGLRVPAGDADRFEKQFMQELDPQTMGLIFRPIKAEQIAAASGGTDFSMFFLMFSFFLIVAAALLVAMLFRLNVEQRARQLGLMSAVGFAPKALRRLALSEGMILALIGGILGIGGAIGYTWLIMLGLRTRWIGAVGTTAMSLHIVPLTLIYGLVASLFVAFCAILWAVWRVGRAQPARLLAGGWGTRMRRRGDGKWPRYSGIAAAVIGIIIVVIALAGKLSAEEGFGGGTVLLVGLLLWLSAELRPRAHAGASFVGAGSLMRLGVRNAARHTGRGVLAVGLIAFAAFTLITVAAMKQEGVKDSSRKDSETGGYQLILESGISLTGDLNTVSGRKILGFKKPDDPLYAGVHFTMLRRWAGQDISCLNLTKPHSPTILGIPHEMIERGGFIAGDSVEKGKLWSLLEFNQGDKIPVICDSDTQEYVLQIPMAGTIPLTDQLGTPRKLKLVATVAHSIFQGQLLMGEANFRKLFPAQSGYGVALVESAAGHPPLSPDQTTALARSLSSELGDYSVSVDTTSARLQAYQNVQNTYLETFQTLGALGLMLGTIGLAVVLVRTVIERKAELALLASLGFAPITRVRLVLGENAFLLILGLALGAASAIVGILPAVLRDRRPINAVYLAVTLGIVLLVGLLSSTIAVSLSGVHVAPADLRRE